MDTVDKIVSSYFAAVATEPFGYKNKIYQPKLLQVSVGMFTKRMNCVEECGACCHKFTLDWLPNEQIGSIYATPREVEINGRKRVLMTDAQEEVEGHHCQFLGDKARCEIHGEHPFSCDFELLRFSHFKAPDRNNYLNHRPYGRAWNMKRQDGERGALCEWYDASGGEEEMLTWQRDTVRRLMRLRDWCRHWEIPNSVDSIIEWVRTGPHKEPLVTGKEYVRLT